MGLPEKRAARRAFPTFAQEDEDGRITKYFLVGLVWSKLTEAVGVDVVGLSPSRKIK